IEDLAIQILPPVRRPTQKAKVGLADNDRQGGDAMKGYWRSAVVLTASIVAGSSPLYAHEECEDISQKQSAVVASGESVGPPSQPAAAVTIQLFQYQPGQLEIQAGT